MIKLNETLFTIGQFHTENKQLLGLMVQAECPTDQITNLYKKNNALQLKALETSDIKELKNIVDDLDAMYDHIKFDILNI